MRAPTTPAAPKETAFWEAALLGVAEAEDAEVREEEPVPDEEARVELPVGALVTGVVTDVATDVVAVVDTDVDVVVETPVTEVVVITPVVSELVVDAPPVVVPEGSWPTQLVSEPDWMVKGADC